MKENVFEVIMFLFDHYLNAEVELLLDGENLGDELEDAGFTAAEINKAFAWLSALAEACKASAGLIEHRARSVRIFTEEEQNKLDPACLDFMIKLDNARVLAAQTREIIIESAMAIEVEILTLQQFKRIITLVLLNSAKQTEKVKGVELFMEEEETVLH
jgi:Smg protein